MLMASAACIRSLGESATRSEKGFIPRDSLQIREFGGPGAFLRHPIRPGCELNIYGSEA